MKVLIVGVGAREHALARSFHLDHSVSEVHVAPGNPGIGRIAQLHDRNPNDGAAIAALAKDLAVDLVVVGPESPLVDGVADAVRDVGIPCFGPTAQAAQIEGSKAFAKDIMAAANVPTATPRVCTTGAEFASALEEFGAPYVVKDDGLAAGKGVVVTDDLGEASVHGAAILEAGGTIVVEEFLDGPEVSLFCISDGTTVVPLQPAQDFKRAFDGDFGLNTGGMGAYSPLPWAPAELVDDVIRTVAQPTIDEMARRGTPFQGVLYCGLALTSHGMRVVEFNARFGDPEAQSVLALLETPLAGILLAAAEGRLSELPPLEWSADAAVTVVVASHGYPESPRKGDVITGTDQADQTPGAHVLHAGTATNAAGELISAGGRTLSVVGRGQSLGDARSAAYAALDKIHIAGSHFRSDIGLEAAIKAGDGDSEAGV